MPTCRDIMTSEVATLEQEMTLRDAVELLRAEGVTGAPVVSGAGDVVGVISATDLLEFEATTGGVPTERPEMLGLKTTEASAEWEPGEDPPSAYFLEMWSDAGADVLERFSETEGPEWDVLAEHVVGEIMTRSVCSVSPDEELRAVARYMHERGVHRVLVLEDGALEGIVTATDFVRALAEGVL